MAFAPGPARPPGAPAPNSRFAAGFAPPSSVNPLEAAIMGGVDGVSFGFADELAGLAGDQYKQAYRDRQKLAEQLHPGFYTGGQIASAFVPGMGIAKGLGAAGKAGMALARGAEAAGAATKAANPALGLVKGLGGMVAGGLGYGTLNRLGQAEGDASQRVQDGLSVTNALTDAGAGVIGGAAGGAIGMVAAPLVGAAIRGGQTFKRVSAQRQAFDRALSGATADETANIAETAATMSSRLNDDFLATKEAQLAAERLGIADAAAQKWRVAAQWLGIPGLTKSQGAAADTGHLWKAYSGLYGDRAKEMARNIVEEQYRAVPGALRRAVGGEAGDASVVADRARQTVDDLAGVAQRMDEDVDRAYAELDQFKDVRLRTSDRGARGLRLIGDRMSEALRGAVGTFRGQSVLEAADPLVRRQAMAQTPLAFRFYRGTLADLVERGGSGKAGGAASDDRFGSLLAARQELNTLLRSAQQGSQDQRALMAMKSALDDTLLNDDVLDTVITARGAGAVEALQRANRANFERQRLFGREANSVNKFFGRAVQDKDSARLDIEPLFVAEPQRFVDTLIGATGVNPQTGSARALEVLKEKVGPSSPEWQNLKLLVVTRLTDQIERAFADSNAPDSALRNAKVMESIQGQLDTLLNRHRPFAEALLEPAEIQRLGLIRDILKRIQSPASDPSGPSVQGMAALMERTPGLATATRLWREGVAGPRGVRRELQSQAPPGPIGSALKSGAFGMLAGPRGIPGSVGMGAANAATAQGILGMFDAPMTEQEREYWRSQGVAM